MVPMRASTMSPLLLTSTSSLSDGSRYTFTPTRSPGWTCASAARCAEEAVTCARARLPLPPISIVSINIRDTTHPVPALIVLSVSSCVPRQRAFQLPFPVGKGDRQLARRATTVEQPIPRTWRRGAELSRGYREEALHAL